MSLFKAFHERAAAFKDDTQGSMAIFFGLTLGAMLSLAGAAIDIGRSVQATALLQQAIDSAALAAVNTALAENTDLAASASFETTVNQFMEANLQIALANGAPLAMDAEYAVSVADGNLTVTAQAPLQAGFTRLFGVETLDIAARTVVKIPLGPDPETIQPASTTRIATIRM